MTPALIMLDKFKSQQTRAVWQDQNSRKIVYTRKVPSFSKPIE